MPNRQICRNTGLVCIDLIFSDFDAAPRHIFEIPEIVEWTKSAHESFSDLLYWLTPDSILRFLFCLDTSSYKKLSGENVEPNPNSKEIILGMAATSGMLAYSALKDAGMSAESIQERTI